VKHPIFISCVVAAMLVGTAVAADAVTLYGKTLDGQSYGATVYGPLGMQDGRVVFMGDHARVYLSNGMFVTLRLAEGGDIRDPNFISASGLDGQTYRLQLKGSVSGFGSIDDVVGPRYPGPGQQ